MADSSQHDQPLYTETCRPQFHFTARKNWLNDPNGLVFYKGEYHMLFQYDPGGLAGDSKAWGQAISTDLVHWQELDVAIHPDELGAIYSGSAVVDWNNTSDLQTGDEHVLVALYTSAGDHAPVKKPYTQSMAYSNDRGRTWTKYDGNPVLGHVKGGNRDPKVIWHAPSGGWIMALYLDGCEYALFSSPDLRNWLPLSLIELPGSSECPDLFELPVDGDVENTRWVFWGANGVHVIGTFDGRQFTKQVGPLPSEWGPNGYAGQTWSDISPEDGRRLQILWMARGEYPGMPFNQQMSFPCELTLRTLPDGIRLCRRPVKEIESIRGREHVWADTPLNPGENILEGIEGELFEIKLDVELGVASEVGLRVRDATVKYLAREKRLQVLGRAAALEPREGRIALHMLYDRTSIEVFADGGRVAFSQCFLPDADDKSLTLYAEGGAARIVSLQVWELKSIWPAGAS